MKILLADDNRDALETLAEILKLEKHDVFTATDGLAALALARTCRPEVLLLDISMPGLDGYELCRQLRREPWGGDALIIALSGYGSAQDLERCREAGFDRHFTKPADPDELIGYMTAGGADQKS